MSKERKVDQGIVLSILLLFSAMLPLTMTGFPVSASIPVGSACGGSSCGSRSSGSSGCGNSGSTCGSGGSCATTGSSGCGSPSSSRDSGKSNLGSSPIVSSTGCGSVGASARGTQTSGLAGGCRPGANSGCSGAATGCGPPTSQGSRGDMGSVSSNPSDFEPLGPGGIVIPPPPPDRPEDNHVYSESKLNVTSEAILSDYLLLYGYIYKSASCTCPTCVCFACDCAGTLRGIRIELWGGILLPQVLQTVYSRDFCSCGRSGADCTCRPPGLACSSDCGRYEFYVNIGSGGRIWIRIIFEGKSGATGYDDSGDAVALTVHHENEAVYVAESAPWDEVPGPVNKNWFFNPLGSTGSSDEIAHIYLDDWKAFAYARDNYGFANGARAHYYPSDIDPPYCTGFDIHYSWWNGYLDTEITDSILHEYSHSLMVRMYGGAWPNSDCSTVCGSQPGGCDFGSGGDCWNHGGSATKCSCDAVTEGWARFFPPMIHNDPVYNWVSYTSGIDIDDEPSTQGEKDEWGFGGILWDIWEDVDSKNTYNIFHSLEVHDPGTVQEFYYGYPGFNMDILCPIFAKHGIGSTATYWRCAGDVGCDCSGTSYCDGNAGWCDSLSPQQGCNLPYQACGCYAQGITKVCSHTSPDNYCWWGCGYWRSCGYTPCGGTGCPGGVDCLDCEAGWCDSSQPGQGCNGAFPSQCACYWYGVTSVCSNAPPYFYCVSGCWKNPCDCNGVGSCPATGCYTCTGMWMTDDCDCGGYNCICGYVNDCDEFMVNDFMPCGGITDCECGGIGCACPDYPSLVDAYCNLAPPSPGGWVLLATDPDEGVGTNLAEIYGQRYSGAIYFRVQYHIPWTTIADISTRILLDSDQNPGTGMPDGSYPGQATGIGADYMIVVGSDGTEMWRWTGFWNTTNPIALAYLDAHSNASVFTVGIRLVDLPQTEAIDCAVIDLPSAWDWMPNSGHFTFELPAWKPCGGTVVDTCDCGGADCTCGFEQDCVVFPVGDYMPCGGAAVDDSCDCGGAGCNCGSESDCAAFPVNNFMPCGGITPCECGGAGCLCVGHCALQSWILLASDPDEGVGTNLMYVLGQLYSGVIYFVVVHYRTWTTIADIDTVILLDSDQNPGTGMPDGSYPGQATGMGADYMIVVGLDGTEMWRWVGSWWDTANPIALAYLDASSGASVFTVGVYLGDLVTVGALDCAVADAASGWDWMPNSVHFTMPLVWKPCGGTVVDTCDCGVRLCACGFENDCASYAVDDFWPCGLTAAHDVAVTAVTASKMRVGRGYTVQIEVIVENHGDFTESFNLTSYYGDSAITPEQWEAFWSLGDVNRDGYINGTDQNLLSAAFGATPSSGNWNPWADLNQDLTVNLSDIVIFSNNYGLEIWTYAISGGVIETLPVIDLAAGTTRTLTFTWDTSSISYGNYLIGGYAAPILGKEPPLGKEVDRADNTFADGAVTVTIPGDIDGDGDVDYFDFILLAGAYASTNGQPAYNPQADIDGDGDVDYFDFIVLAGNYSKSIP